MQPVVNPVVNPAPVVRQREPGEIIKPALLDKFKEEPKQIQKFFTNIRNYFSYFPTTIADDIIKIQTAGSCLAKTTKDWFKPHLRDYKQTKTPKKQYTLDLFASYTTFKQQLKKLYGKTNESKEAEDALL
ncbi:hypothetical protein CI102_15426 [Trichoderma harzianum]|nr:hypothetical protein CI102_15426 [Trichoderma harzianum]